jgi:oxygen-dependent protoporphyrinogen oxidase
VTSRRAIVVGAGVAGLSAAFRLQQAGFDVTVLEAADRVGGKTASVARDGFVLNTGATVLAGSYAAMKALAADAGVGDQLIAPPSVIAVVRDGRAHEIRTAGIGAVIDFSRTPLLPWRSKLRLVKTVTGLLRARTRVGYDRPDLRATLDTESVASYCNRVLDAEIRDHLIDPLLGGIYVVDGTSLSVADLWFTIWKVLLGGLLGYRGGIDFYARALASRLDVRTSAPVTNVSRAGSGAEVTWSDALGDHGEQVDAVVLAVPAPAVRPIFPELDPVIAALMDSLEQATFVSVRLGLSRRPATRSVLTVAGSGQLGGIATISYEHHLAPGSAPHGKGLIGLLMYHEWVSARSDWSDDQIIAAALTALEQVEPGISALVELTDLTRWTPGSLKTVPGTHRTIARIDHLLDPADPIQLAGDYRTVPSINGSVVSGEIAARRLALAHNDLRSPS